MSKNTLFLLLFLFFVFITAYKISGHIQNFFLDVTDATKLTYLKTYEYIENSFQKHFNQAETIENLNNEIKTLRKSEILYTYYKNEYKSLAADLNITPDTNTTVKLSRTISYVTMGNYKKIWLDFDAKKENKIYGILQGNSVAGIIIPKDGRSLALLNGDEKCSYSVYIGKNKAPGIVNGSAKDGEIVVDFIPSWIKIEAGDQVLTSGLDNIFFEGIAVGVVDEISYKDAYQRATVKPYADTLHPEYFWVIE